MCQFDFNVLEHLFDQFVLVHVLSFLRVEAEAVNDPQQTGAAHDLLRDAVELMLDVGVDIRDHVFFRYRRLLDENERARPVGGTNQPTGSPDQEPAAEKGQEELPPPTANYTLNLDKIERLACWFQFFFHACIPGSNLRTTFLLIYIPKGLIHWYDSVTKNRFRCASSVTGLGADSPDSS